MIKRVLPPHPATVVQRRALAPHPATVGLGLRGGSARVGAVQCKACGTVQRSAAAAPTTVQVTADGHFWLWTTDLSITVLGTRFPDDLGAAPAHDQGCGRLHYLIGSKWYKTGWTSWKTPGMTKSQHIERKVVAAIETAVSDVRGNVKATVLDILQGNTPCSGDAGCAMWFANGGGDIFASSKTAVVRLKSHTTYESSLLPFYPTNTYHSTRHSANDNDVDEDGYFIFHNIVKSWTPTPCSSCFP